MLKTALTAVAAAGAMIATLGMTAASADAAQASTAPAGTKSVPGIQAGSVGCTSTKCVVVGMTAPAGTAGKTALITATTGAVKLGRRTLGVSYGTVAGEVACPDRTTCLALAFRETTTGAFESIISINTTTGVQKLAAALPDTAQYYLNAIACPDSKYCYAVGSTMPNGVQLPTWGLLLKLSPAGKILKKTVSKSYYSYGPIGCESNGTCLIDRETRKFGFQVMTLRNGRFGRAHALGSFTTFDPVSISCYSDKLCYQAGVVDNGNGTNTAKIAPVNPATGVRGKIVRLPLVVDGTLTSSFPLDVACYSSTRCVLASDQLKGTVSNGYPEAVYEVITRGKPGKVMVADTSTMGSAFYSVSCASRTECYAVGWYYTSGNPNAYPSIIDKV